MVEEGSLVRNFARAGLLFSVCTRSLSPCIKKL